MNPDLSLFRSINALAGKSAVLDGVGHAFAQYAPAVFLVALLGLWLTRSRPQQRAVLLAGVSTLCALGIAQLMGLAYPRPRPYAHHAVHLLVARTTDTSFPSDHATFGFAIVVTVLLANRPVGVLLLILSVLMCVARVFVGAHYPTDLLAGALLGTAVSGVFWWIGQRDPVKTWLEVLLARLKQRRLA